MKKLFSIITLTFTSAVFAQTRPNIDSLRQVHMERIKQMQSQRQQASPAGQIITPPVNQSSGQIVIPPMNQSSSQSSSQPTATPQSPADADRLTAIKAKLDTLAKSDKHYDKEVESMSVAGLSLPELLRNIAKIYDVNIEIKGSENIRITSNIARARITDLLFFLCKEHNLDVDITGNIVSIFPAVPPAAKPKIINITAEDGKISFDLRDDRLPDAARMLTQKTGENFIIPTELNSKTITAHGRDMTVKDAVQAICAANGLRARRAENGIWEIAALDAKTSYTHHSAFSEDQLIIDSLSGLITAKIANGNVQEIITDLCERQKLNYFFVTPINYSTPLNVQNTAFETLLSVMFTGTEYGYYRENGIWFFGTFNKETLASVRVIPLSYRSVSALDEAIPAHIKDGLELKVMTDLNSIVVSGDQRKVQRVENFLASIDRRVPLVTIEVMIMEATHNVIMDAGLGLGMGTAPTTTTGQFSPGVDMTLGAGAVNKLLDKGSALSSMNLGKVSPLFYANLKMLEENGDVTIRSTPKLSTLNGNPANLKSGEKNYYKEVQTNYWGSQTPTPSESYTWKEIEANLEIKITPFISSDGLITLDIEIIQSEFTDRVEKDGPLGMVSRSFKSIIRVGDGDMVLLGGIDRNSKTVSNAGLPFIARVPVLKWIFGKSKREKRDQTLNVFIKPTLVE